MTGSPADAAPHDDRSSRALCRRTLAFAGVGTSAYLLALIATIPATMVLQPSRSVVARAGTLWSGEAALAGGDRLRWRWAPLRSLARLGFAVGWQLTGPESDLAGHALLWPDGPRVDAVSGRAGGSLIEALAPDLPFRCALRMNFVAEPDVTARSGRGMCRLKASPAQAAPLPPLFASMHADGGRAVVTVAPLAARRRMLLVVQVDGRRHATITLTGEGARLLPFAAAPGGAGLTIETDL